MAGNQVIGDGLSVNIAGMSKNQLYDIMYVNAGVPTIVDLAGMRNAMDQLGGNPSKINPLVPVDLVIDHSVQVDVSRSENALQVNLEYLARVVFNSNGILYPDTVLGRIRIRVW
ncbi:hypothetical protein L1887_22962 [Cichorium endivia]|nr:hypothetical protein L1887_22962 [Cichorium endivia]